jgi:hypothetical protein
VDQPLASSEDEESALIPCQVGEDGDNVVYSFATPAPVQVVRTGLIGSKSGFSA